MCEGVDGGGCGDYGGEEKGVLMGNLERFDDLTLDFCWLFETLTVRDIVLSASAIALSHPLTAGWDKVLSNSLYSGGIRETVNSFNSVTAPDHPQVAAEPRQSACSPSTHPYRPFSLSPVPAHPL